MGDSELRIVASQDIGQLGPNEGSPVAFPWRWYYHVPTLGLWALLILLLIVPKANRHRQAWLILVPVGVVLLVLQMTTTLLSMPDQLAAVIDFFVTSVAMAWGAVWLVGHWLGVRSRKVAFLVIFVAMAAVGLLSFWCHYMDSEGLGTFLVAFSWSAAVLPLAMLWTSHSCRTDYSPARFRRRLLVRMIAPSMVVMLSFAVIVLVPQLLREPAFLASMLLQMLILSLVYGGVLYLLNLPFLELALRSSFYGDRLERTFHVERGREPAVAAVME